MTDSAVKPVEKLKIAPKPLKFRTEDIVPSMIVDVCRLYENSLKLAPPQYPSMHEEHIEVIRSHLFQMISSPQFVGVMVKQGKRPIGQMTGVISGRAFGAPRIFLQMGLFWVEPDFRKSGVGKLLKQALFRASKARGVHYWESNTETHLVETFMKMGEARQVGVVLAGKIELE